MIPVSLPGGNYYASLVLSLICLSTLLTWLARLAVDRGARQWLRGHRRLGPAMMAVLAVAGGIFPYQHVSQWLAAQREARDEQARRAVLDAGRRLAGIDMPAGTTLRLAEAGNPDSFVQADFPTQVEIGGLLVRQLFRYRRAAGANSVPTESWSVTLPADQPVQGWTCSHHHRAELLLDRRGKPRFDSCHLAAGNTLDGQPLPAGTWLDLRQEAPARWLLRTDGREPAVVQGLPLLKADISVDDRRRLLSFEGLLAHELTLGALTYPTGTRAGSATGVSGAQPGDLLFSPPRGRSARRDGEADVAAGQSVLQAPDGTVRAVLGNHEAGVLDVATMRIGP